MDVEEILNECLSSKTCAGMFTRRRTRNLAIKVMDVNNEMMIEIDSVTLTKDGSHADAFWQSNVLNDFIKLVKEKNGEIDGAALHLKTSTNITKRLQMNESKFRSAIARKMNFKRVPRVFFHPSEDLVISSVLNEAQKTILGANIPCTISNQNGRDLKS